MNADWTTRGSQFKIIFLEMRASFLFLQTWKGGLAVANSYVNILDYKAEKQKSLRENEYLNLPDLQFFLWCQKNYRINKGVFNTIDNWFYTNGVVSIIHRRIYILAFLEFVKRGDADFKKRKYIRFGNGGLSKKLHQFMNEIMEQ